MEYLCPKCQQPMKRWPRKSNPDQYYWVCSQKCCYCDDWEGAPYLLQCEECGDMLKRRISPKTGQPYTACFNKEKHSSGQVIFYREDGTKQNTLQAKGTFQCPQCHAELLYREVRKGPNQGKRIFICNNQAGHANGKVLFFADNDGVPLIH